jgi:hypothetical protein
LEYKIADIEIPFNRKTNSPIIYPMSYMDIRWEKNYIFDEILFIYGISRGTSSATFNASDENEIQYNIFMKDILYIIQNAKIENGKIHGLWTFIKRGKNYGVRFLDNVEDIK